MTTNTKPQVDNMLRDELASIIVRARINNCTPIDVYVGDLEQLFATHTQQVRDEAIQAFAERLLAKKRTMGHIDGAKRVDTDYVLVSDITAIQEEQSGKKDAI